MKNLGIFLPEQFNIAGYKLEIKKEKGADLVFCPYTINTFSKVFDGEADFSLTVKKNCTINKLPDGKQISVYDNRIVLDYGTEIERLFIESNKSLTYWKLYTSYKDGQIDDWFNKIGDLFAWAMPGKNSLVLHGVLLEWDGKGIILTAPSGTGKTTHARLWREFENALIINGDRVLIKKENNQWFAYGIPWSGSSGECINRKITLDAIVFLNRGKENIVEKVSPFKGFRKILPRIIAPKWHEEYQKLAIDLSINCIETVPLFDLYCLPDRQSVKVLKRNLSDL